MAGNRPTPLLLASPDDDVKLVQRWLDDCVGSHDACRAAHRSFLPSRLIDVTAFDNSTDVKLVETADLEKVSLYTALSHRWGSSPDVRPPQTNTSNYEQHRVRIAHDSLSLSFRDAVRITRALGIHYLWIDSLCIVQDSSVDWENEASQMGQVYAGSYCTLAATASSSGLEGCRRGFQNTGITIAPRSVKLEFGSMQVMVFECSPLDWNWELERGVLQKRAWTLQERKLSTRVVYYCDNLLLWECQSLKASSELPWFQMVEDDPPTPLLLNSSEDLATESRSLLHRELWFAMIQDYSSRGLTKEKDRLPALEGLAEREMTLHRGKYLAGLWEMDLPSALLWQVNRELPECKVMRPSMYRAPSWSWASVEGPVTYKSQRTWATMTSDQERIAVECNFGRFNLEEVYVERRNLRVSNGFLRVSGDLLPVMVDTRTTQPREGFINIRSQMGATIGLLYPDIEIDPITQHPLFCLRIRDEPGGSEVSISSEALPEIRGAGYDSEAMSMGLALRSQAGSKDCYERVGLIRYMREAAMTAAATRSVVIH